MSCQVNEIIIKTQNEGSPIETKPEFYIAAYIF